MTNFLIFVSNLVKRIHLFEAFTRRPGSPQQSRSSPQLPTIQGTQANATHPTDQQPPPSNTDAYMRMQLALSVIGVCFTTAGTALLALRTPRPLPTIFHWLCMALMLSFLCVIVSMYIRRCIQVASLVMDHVALFLAFTAFMLAISMNFPTPFLGITVALYFIAILLVIFANLLMPRDTSNP